jgi:hypothetical protein
MAIWHHTSFGFQMMGCPFPRGWIEPALAGLETNRFLKGGWYRLVHPFPCFIFGHKSFICACSFALGLFGFACVDRGVYISHVWSKIS